MTRRTSLISIFAAILAAVLAIGAPAALAHHKDDHAWGGGKPASSETKSSKTSDHDGDADSDSNTTYTEDNDGDGKKNNEDTTPSSHPSGRDKTIEGGGSGNQGRSESDPDDDGRGPERCEPVSSRTTGDGTCGADKPNGTGGTDIYDQDGNNGCGNDQDFDDDNEGWCGKPTEVKSNNEIKGEKPDDVLGGVIAKPTDDEIDEEVEVLPELVTNPSAPTVDSVLGKRINAAAQPAEVAAAAVAPAAVAAAPAAQGGVLPFTGASDLLPLFAVGLMLIAAGGLSLRGRFSSK